MSKGEGQLHIRVHHITLTEIPHMPVPFQPSLTCYMIPQKEYKEGVTGLCFFPTGFEPLDVQAGPEHLLFLPWPPTRWQFRVSIVPAYVSSHSELATGPAGPS